MKRVLITALLACLTLSLGGANLLAFEGGVARIGTGTEYAVEVTVANLNLRNGAGTKYAPIHIVKKGDTLLVVAEKKGWLKVLLPAKTPCWIAKKLVETTGADKCIVKKANVNIRAVPDKYGGDIVGQVTKGEVLTIIKEKAGWYKITRPAHLTGWVSKRFTKKWGTLEEYQERWRKEDARLQLEAELKEDLLSAQELYKTESQREDLKDRDYTQVITLLNKVLWSSRDKDTLAKAKSLFRETKPQQDEINRLRIIDIQDHVATRINRNEFKRDLTEIFQPKGILATGWVKTAGKMFKRPAAYKLVKGKKTIYFLKPASADINFKDCYNEHVSVNGEVIENPGWPQKTIIVREIRILVEE